MLRRARFEAEQVGRRVLDTADRLTGRHEELVPPRHLMYDGPPTVAAYRSNGEEFLGYFKELGNLQPTGRVLDVGSGMGRKTRPLTTYLQAEGQYDGVDPVRAGVEWCTRNISTRYPNFRFHHLDIYNERYNATGALRADEVVLPVEDDSVDLVVLGSVFTHMLPGDIDHYLAEIARVLKPGGRSLISWFLLNDESRPLVAQGRAAHDFRHRVEMYMVENPDVPEQAIAFDEEFARAAYAKHGLAIVEPVRYGSWCRRATYLSFQDLVVAERPATSTAG